MPLTTYFSNPTSCQAHTIDLETKLKPFVPDYIPSVGSIDEFIKVPRPDGKPDFLGLKVGGGDAGERLDRWFPGRIA